MRRASLICILLAAAAIIAAEAPRSAPSQPEDAAAAQPNPAEPAAPTEAQPPADAPPTTDPAAPPTPAQPPAPTPAPTPAPPPLPAPPQPEFVSPRQPVFGPLLRVPPAQRIAMQETGLAVLETDPMVARAAELLTGLTARYVEDAPRIAELTIRTCNAVRRTNRPASPVEMLEGALKWKRPATYPGNVPRRFEGYAAAYRKLRVDEAKDHTEALSIIQGTPAPRNDAVR